MDYDRKVSVDVDKQTLAIEQIDSKKSFNSAIIWKIHQGYLQVTVKLRLQNVVFSNTRSKEEGNKEKTTKGKEQ